MTTEPKFTPVKGRVHFDTLPPPVRRSILALQLSLHNHTSYQAAQVTFLDILNPNEFIKPIIDVRPSEDYL